MWEWEYDCMGNGSMNVCGNGVWQWGMYYVDIV